MLTEESFKVHYRPWIRHESLASIAVLQKKKTNHEEEIKETISKPEKTIQFYEEL